MEEHKIWQRWEVILFIGADLRIEKVHYERLYKGNKETKRLWKGIFSELKREWLSMVMSFHITSQVESGHKHIWTYDTVEGSSIGTGDHFMI